MILHVYSILIIPCMLRSSCSNRHVYICKIKLHRSKVAVLCPQSQRWVIMLNTQEGNQRQDDTIHYKDQTWQGLWMILVLLSLHVGACGQSWTMQWWKEGHQHCAVLEVAWNDQQCKLGIAWMVISYHSASWMKCSLHWRQSWQSCPWWGPHA